MNIARPPGGFKVVISKPVEEYILAESKDNHRLPQYWSDVLNRLKFVALSEGTPLNKSGVRKFMYIADGLPHYNLPTIKIIYDCFGDTLTVTNALVYQESDYEED